MVERRYQTVIDNGATVPESESKDVARPEDESTHDEDLEAHPRVDGQDILIQSRVLEICDEPVLINLPVIPRLLAYMCM